MFIESQHFDICLTLIGLFGGRVLGPDRGVLRISKIVLFAGGQWRFRSVRTS